MNFGGSNAPAQLHRFAREYGSGVAALGVRAKARCARGRLPRPWSGSASALACCARAGLGSEGFVDGRNMRLEYRSADGGAERLSELAADLARREAAVIAASGSSAALAAKRVTPSIPIVFLSGVDPVQIGLVLSFNRPGGNITGFYFRVDELTASGWRCCMSCCLWLSASLYWSIPQKRQQPNRRCGRCWSPDDRSAWTSRSSAQVPARRSMRLSVPCRAGDRTHYLSAPIRFLLLRGRSL